MGNELQSQRSARPVSESAESRMSAPGLTVLAFETSCDETAVAVVRDGILLSSEVASQVALHAEYGGVVPEVASRNHLVTLQPVAELAMKSAGISWCDISAVAATRGPGLATSLMLGASMAKGLAVALRKPFIAVNHIEGHLLSPFFVRRSVVPSVGLVVSGGHTMLVDVEAYGSYTILGQTCDDAAGEAFDKVGKLLGLPYPGGPAIDRLAKGGDPKRFDFPRSMMEKRNLQFSFSGLKTSVRYMLPKLEEPPLPDLCASFQEAVVDVLVSKTLKAARFRKRSTLAISGGVSCNSRLRERFREAAAKYRFELLIAEPALCTDNAAMIAWVAFLSLQAGKTSSLEVDVDPNLKIA